MANAIGRGRINYQELVFRPPVAGDPEPVFSNCTLPVIIFKDKENSFNHVLLTVMPIVYHWLSHGGVNRDVTYVVRPRLAQNKSDE